MKITLRSEARKNHNSIRYNESSKPIHLKLPNGGCCGFADRKYLSLSKYGEMVYRYYTRSLSNVHFSGNNIENYHILFLFNHMDRYYTKLNDFESRNFINKDKTLRCPDFEKYEEDEPNSIYGYWRFDYEPFDEWR